MQANIEYCTILTINWENRTNTCGFLHARILLWIGAQSRNQWCTHHAIKLFRTRSVPHIFRPWARHWLDWQFRKNHSTRVMAFHAKLSWHFETLETVASPRGWTIVRKREYRMPAKLNRRYHRDTKCLFRSGVLRVKRLWFFEIRWYSNGWLSITISCRKKKNAFEHIHFRIRWCDVGQEM